MHQILNIADDLDAFSVIGAYRYIEIYLLRHVPIKDLPQAVINNIKQRYNHFTNTFSSDSSIIKKHESRFNTAFHFFNNLATQLNKENYIQYSYQGPIGVVNYIKTEIVDQKKSIPDACLFIKNNSNDNYIKDFFQTINKEYAASTDIKI